MMQTDLFTPVCQLYRHFNAAGRLLYVGQSLHAVARLSGHKRSKWFSQIAKVEVETFPSKKAAEDAERKAIQLEEPIYNVVSRTQSWKPSRRTHSEARREPSSNAQRQAKWRKANTELNRQRAKEGMRKRRAQSKDNAA